MLQEALAKLNQSVTPTGGKRTLSQCPRQGVRQPCLRLPAGGARIWRFSNKRWFGFE
jgi:hypothetical protein